MSEQSADCDAGCVAQGYAEEWCAAHGRECDRPGCTLFGQHPHPDEEDVVADPIIRTMEAVRALPSGQWVQDADGKVACLMDTHVGFPQRMWGFKTDGGTKGRMVYHCALDRIALPLHLADVTGGECSHPFHNECGQCEACGLPGVAEGAPRYFDPEGEAAFRAAAAHNARVTPPEASQP